MDLLSLPGPLLLLLFFWLATSFTHLSSQFGAVWWMQMGTYLIGSVPKMEINGAMSFFFFFFTSATSYFEPLICSAECGENVNEEGRGNAAATGVVPNSERSNTKDSPVKRALHVQRRLSANLVKCLRGMQPRKLSNREAPRRVLLFVVVLVHARSVWVSSFNRQIRRQPNLSIIIEGNKSVVRVCACSHYT